MLLSSASLLLYVAWFMFRAVVARGKAKDVIVRARWLRRCHTAHTFVTSSQQFECCQKENG